MKKCDTCIYRNENEYHKPCIVYRSDCEFYEKERGDMTREEAIKILNKCRDTRFERTIYTLEEYHTATDMAIKALEQEPCEDEYIKVPKKALKYRTAGMVAYNVEWLKNHFDIERAVICGAQEPTPDRASMKDLIDRAECLKRIEEMTMRPEIQANLDTANGLGGAWQIVNAMPSIVAPIPAERQTAHWTIGHDENGRRIIACDFCGRVVPDMEPYCMSCGRRMLKPKEESK